MLYLKNGYSKNQKSASEILNFSQASNREKFSFGQSNTQAKLLTSIIRFDQLGDLDEYTLIENLLLE